MQHIPTNSFQCFCPITLPHFDNSNIQIFTLLILQQLVIWMQHSLEYSASNSEIISCVGCCCTHTRSECDEECLQCFPTAAVSIAVFDGLFIMSWVSDDKKIVFPYDLESLHGLNYSNCTDIVLFAHISFLFHVGRCIDVLISVWIALIIFHFQ